VHCDNENLFLFGERLAAFLRECRWVLSHSVVFLVFIPLPAAVGQVFQLEGGSSSLFQAQGGSVQVRTLGFEGLLGGGMLDGQLRLGGLFRKKWHNSILAIGDDAISLRLPTDLFDSSHYVNGRGASISASNDRISILGFAGATSTGFGTPFFRGAAAEHPAGAFFVDAKLSSKWRLFSRNIASNHQTSISGVEWQPWRTFKTAIAGGVGSDQGYLSASLSADTRFVSWRSTYILAGDAFQRVSVTAPVSSENEKENFLLTVRPVRALEFVAGRFNLLQVGAPGESALSANVNQYSVTMRFAGAIAAGSLFMSRAGGMSSEGTSVSLAGNLMRWLQGGAYLYHSRSNGFPSSTSITTMFQEVVSPRLSLLQLVSHSDGGTSLSWGGQFFANPFSVGVEYQTVYAPFRPGNPFRQVLLLNLRIQPLSFFQLNTGTYVAPGGFVKYTTYGQALAYRDTSGFSGPESYKFGKYVIRGRVTDEAGNAINGAALRVGRDLVFTNVEGKFFVRKKKDRPVTLDVALEEFLIPGVFEVVDCPRTAVPSLTNAETLVRVVVREHRSPIPENL